MKTLALETSAKSVSVAVTENGTLLAQAYQDRGLTHSVTLMPLLDGMLKTAGLTLDDMDIIRPWPRGRGALPGYASACRRPRGWRGPRRCPAAAYPRWRQWPMASRTSRASSWALWTHGGSRYTTHCSGQKTAALRDYARTGPWLWSWWRRNWPPYRSQSSSWATARCCCTTFCRKRGSGCRLASPLHRQQSAAGVALAAEHLAAQGLTCSAQELQPVYLRLSQAERERLARGLSLTAE